MAEDNPSTTTTSVVEAVGVFKVFRTGDAQQVALHDVTFSIGHGEQWTIRGPSGSGKSTLLYLIGALDRPTTGSLKVLGQELSHLSAAERAEFRFRQVGFVFQDFQLLESVSVGENTLLPFVGRPRERHRAINRARQLLESVGLGEAWSKPAGVLSGGEKQRVALVRALINDPPLLLCDEPTGNLDQASGRRIMELLHEFARDASRTLIVITHDDQIAAQFPHQLGLRDGVVVP